MQFTIIMGIGHMYIIQVGDFFNHSSLPSGSSWSPLSEYFLLFCDLIYVSFRGIPYVIEKLIISATCYNNFNVSFSTRLMIVLSKSPLTLLIILLFTLSLIERKVLKSPVVLEYLFLLCQSLFWICWGYIIGCVKV